jgi:hypothetical protein
MFYQGITPISRTCAASCIEDLGGSTSGGLTTKNWCCINNYCNFSSTIASNKLLTGFSIYHFIKQNYTLKKN